MEVCPSFFYTSDEIFLMANESIVYLLNLFGDVEGIIVFVFIIIYYWKGRSD